MRRFRRLLIAAALPLICLSCSQRDGNSWDPTVYKALQAVMEEGRGRYAVFDFDKTSIVHDISQALWVYQIEHLEFADAPEHLFMDGIPDSGREIYPGLTLAAFGSGLKAEYDSLRAMLDAGASLGDIHSTPTYLDFRAKMHCLLCRMDGLFERNISYLWMPGLLAGYTEEQARSLVRDAIREHLGKDRIAVENWESPDGLWEGRVERGIFFSPEMKKLYREMKRSGIDAYVCSASLELIVEELACDPVLGPGLPPERVFGLRFVPSDTLRASFDPDYPQPMGSGKVECIKECIAPEYGGRGPVLVAGDSNGDVPMLSSFSDMAKGLIIDVGRNPDSPIGSLAARARTDGVGGTYLLQTSFVPSEGSI